MAGPGILSPSKMKSRRLCFLAALALVPLLVSGCQLARWLRLLSFKNQLAQVERYVRIEDQGGLVLHFSKPVVYADDLSLLIQGETSRKTNQNRSEWIWSYEKQPAEGALEAGEFDLSFTLGFENSKLSDVRFGEHFLGLMPKPLIVGLLRSVGQADVNVKRGTVAMKWAGPGPGQKVELPTKSQLARLLGAPARVSQNNGRKTHLYKYYQKVFRDCPPCERLAWAMFSFGADGEEIASSEGVIGNIGWRMLRVKGEAEPRVTFSLEPLNVEPVALELPGEITGAFVGRFREPAGTLLSVGCDGGTFVLSWTKDDTGGWCEALPEQTNTLFGLPAGLPRATFLRDNCGVVTGLVAELQGQGTLFTRVANELAQPRPCVPLDPAMYAACAGRYKASWGGFVIISRTGDQLFWQKEPLRARLPLYPASETNFFFKAVDSPLTFVRNRQGEVTKLVVHYNGRTAEAAKLKSGQSSR